MTLPNFAENLQKYADLTVNTGIGVKNGDTVYIQIAVDQAPLARLLTAAAYKAGAAEVLVQWNDDTISRLDMQNKDDDRLFNIPNFITDQFDYWLDHNAKRITVISADPDNLKGIDADRVATYQDAYGKAYGKLLNAISSNKSVGPSLPLPVPNGLKKSFLMLPTQKLQPINYGTKFSRRHASMRTTPLWRGKSMTKPCAKRQHGSTRNSLTTSTTPLLGQT